MRAHVLRQPAAAKLVARRAQVVCDAVGVKHDGVARLGLEDGFVVLALLQQAQRHAFHADVQDLGAPANHGRQSARVGHYDSPRGGVPQHHAQRHVARLHFALYERIVEGFQKLGRMAAARGQGAQQADEQPAIQRRRRALAAHIPEGDHGLPARTRRRYRR